MFFSKSCWIIAICEHGKQKSSKISLWNWWNSASQRRIPQFLNKLESWSERLNTPLHYPQVNHWPKDWPKLLKIVKASLLPPTTHTGWIDPCWIEQLCVWNSHQHNHHPSIITNHHHHHETRVCRLNHGHGHNWVAGRLIWPTFQLPRHTWMPIVWIYTWYIWFYLHTLFRWIKNKMNLHSSLSSLFPL